MKFVEEGGIFSPGTVSTSLVKIGSLNSEERRLSRVKASPEKVR